MQKIFMYSMSVLSQRRRRVTQVKAYPTIFKKKITPLIEDQLEQMSKTDFTIGAETEDITNSMKEIIVSLKKVVDTHSNYLNEINSIIKKMKTFLGPTKCKPYSELMRLGLTADKASLEKALEDKDLESILKLTQKIQSEAEIVKIIDIEKKIILKIRAQIPKIAYIKVYKDLANNLEELTLKCHRMGLNYCTIDWKIDRKYLCPTLFLTLDCLTLGKTTSSGYQGAIGDTPIDTGLMIYEVTPIGLNCCGNEGFGVIELEKQSTIEILLNRDVTVI